MTKEQKSERFNMFLTAQEMKSIDDWAWDQRIRSKSEAVRRLVQMGLNSNEALTEQIALSSKICKLYEALGELVKDDLNEISNVQNSMRVAKLAIAVSGEMALKASQLSYSLAALANKQAAISEHPDLTDGMKAVEQIEHNRLKMLKAIEGEDLEEIAKLLNDVEVKAR